MSWRLSRFRTGDPVQVRSKEEILATLDENGCIDGMPFMPEMLQYCGQQFHIDTVAHKTCETAKRTWQGRRLDTTVHLDNLRCDGSAHGGCQADCKLFFKDEWLKSPGDADKAATTRPLPKQSARCDEQKLATLTQLSRRADSTEPRYSCQATKLYEATTPLRWWDPRQYVLDVTTGNHSAGEVVRALWLAAMRTWVRRTPLGYRAVKLIRETSHRWLVGGDVPDVEGRLTADQPTPIGVLGLKPGERVRIKPKNEIVETIDGNNKNRGLSFDQEMVRYCGSVRTVRNSVNNIINEGTGEMMRMKQPCIILEGVVCTGQYSACRLMCPRELPPFWRELWLERVDDAAPHHVAGDPLGRSREHWGTDSKTAPHAAGSRGPS